MLSPLIVPDNTLWPVRGRTSEPPAGLELVVSLVLHAEPRRKDPRLHRRQLFGLVAFSVWMNANVTAGVAGHPPGRRSRGSREQIPLHPQRPFYRRNRTSYSRSAFVSPGRSPVSTSSAAIQFRRHDSENFGSQAN